MRLYPLYTEKRFFYQALFNRCPAPLQAWFIFVVCPTLPRKEPPLPLPFPFPFTILQSNFSTFCSHNVSALSFRYPPLPPPPHPMNWEESTHLRGLKREVDVRQHGGHLYGRISSCLRLCSAVCRRLRLPLGVFCSAAMYIQRFYLDTARTVAPGEDQHVFTSALLLAVKAHDYPLSDVASTFQSVLTNVSIDASFAYELDILQAMDFAIIVHSPFKTLEVLFSGLRRIGLDDCIHFARQEVICLVESAPLLLCYPPQLLAMIGALYEVDRHIDQTNAKLISRFSALESVQHLTAPNVSTVLTETLACHHRSAALSFATTDNTENDVHRLQFPSEVAEVVIAFLGFTESRPLVGVSRGGFRVWSAAWWQAFCIRGGGGGGGGGASGHPAVLAAGFRPGEFALLRRVSLSIGYSRSARIEGFKFSTPCAEVLRRIREADGVSLDTQNCTGV